MPILYRAVKDNDTDDVIAIGADEDQGGKDYHGIGIWCDFTFDKIPELAKGAIELMNENPALHGLKVSKSKIVAKTLKELKAEIA